jgi:hypothetical protein
MENIDPELKQLLTNLVIEQRAPSGWQPSPNERAFLVSELETALIDRDTLRPIVKHLGGLSGKGAEGERSSFESDEDLDAIMTGGLEALFTRSSARFYVAVVDPFGLMELRDIVLDTLPLYWWELIRRAGGHEPKSAEEIWIAAEAGAVRNQVLTSFANMQGPKRWAITAAAGQATRVLPPDGPAPVVTIEFTLIPGPESWRLDVDILDPPPLSDVARSGRLVLGTGEVLAEGEEFDGLLSFTVLGSEVFAGIELRGEYRRRDIEVIEFRIPLIID